MNELLFAIIFAAAKVREIDNPVLFNNVENNA